METRPGVLGDNNFSQSSDQLCIWSSSVEGERIHHSSGSPGLRLPYCQPQAQGVVGTTRGLQSQQVAMALPSVAVYIVSLLVLWESMHTLDIIMGLTLC